MSISTTLTKHSYDGNNSITTKYPIDFKYLEDTHVKVYFDGVEKQRGAGADYVLDGDGTINTGFITTNVPQPATVTVTIVLDVPFDQPVELLETGLISASTLEEAYDRLNMQIRRVWRKAQDVLTFSSDEANGSTGTADNLIGFDGSGDIAEIPNTTFLQTANDLSDVDAATARTNLGVDAAGTDNSTDVTKTGAGTYISLAGQVLTVDEITESDVSDLGAYIENVTGSPLSELQDVTITTPISGQVISWNGSAWVNAVSGNGDALVADGLDQFAATTSLELKDTISDETGSGSLVFATSPTLVTPALGTPSAVDLTYATNTPLPAAGTVTETMLNASTNTSLNLADASMQPATYDPNTVAGDAFDSANHTYTPAGTGAVDTVVETKLRESVSVKDFGAVGNGIANDTVAIQAAIDSITTQGAILFPRGTYKVTGTLTVTKPTSFYGESSYGGRKSKILMHNPENVAVTKIFYVQTYDTSFSNLEIGELEAWDSNPDYPITGVYYDRSSAGQDLDIDSWVHGCFFRFTKYGIYSLGRGLNVRDCYFATHKTAVVLDYPHKPRILTTNYVVGDRIVNGGNLYTCIVAHTATDPVFNNEISNWEQALPLASTAAWTSTTYALGDRVSVGTITYVCLVGHTATSFAVDKLAGYWQQDTANDSVFSDWSVQQFSDVGGSDVGSGFETWTDGYRGIEFTDNRFHSVTLSISNEGLNASNIYGLHINGISQDTGGTLFSGNLNRGSCIRNATVVNQYQKTLIIADGSEGYVVENLTSVGIASGVLTSSSAPVNNNCNIAIYCFGTQSNARFSNLYISRATLNGISFRDASVLNNVHVSNVMLKDIGLGVDGTADATVKAASNPIKYNATSTSCSLSGVSYHDTSTHLESIPSIVYLSSGSNDLQLNGIQSNTTTVKPTNSTSASSISLNLTTGAEAWQPIINVVDINGDINQGIYSYGKGNALKIKTSTGASTGSVYLDLAGGDTNAFFAPLADNAHKLGSASFRWSDGYVTTVRTGDGTTIVTSGTGTPEGVVTAAIGSMYSDTSGGAGTTLYIKESGTGNTGWVAK